MSTKDFAGWAGLFIVGVIGFVLGFAQVLADRHILTVELTAWIAFGLTLMSFACFGFERIENSKEELKRNADKAQSDQDRAEILKRVREIQEKQQTLTEDQLVKLDHAEKLYKILSEPPKASDATASLIAGILMKSTGLVTMASPNIFGEAIGSVIQFVKTRWRDKPDDREIIRAAADSLVLSALGVPDEKLPIV